jgi:hypothetical protein
MPGKSLYALQILNFRDAPYVKLGLAYHKKMNFLLIFEKIYIAIDLGQANKIAATKRRRQLEH